MPIVGQTDGGAVMGFEKSVSTVTAAAGAAFVFLENPTPQQRAWLYVIPRGFMKQRSNLQRNRVE